jgi:hypothetical protein
VPLRRLVKEALRMRPSRIIVGEVRQAESLDLLIALKSGVTRFSAEVTVWWRSNADSTGVPISHDAELPGLPRYMRASDRWPHGSASPIVNDGSVPAAGPAS